MIRFACTLIIASAVLSACATTPYTAGHEGKANAAALHPASPLSVKSDPHCIRSTGTLIKPPKRQCSGLPGSSYSGKELRRTGAIDTVDALRMLDPAVH